MKSLILSSILALCVCVAAAQQETDLVVRDKTLVQRCVLKGVKSSRVVAVGQPGGFNYAFDVLNCAPVSTWIGGFLDFSGETNARGGKGCKALGILQAFGADTNPLRIGDASQMPESIRFGGYRRNEVTGIPTFLFSVNGVPVEQEIVSDSPNTVRVNLTFPEKGNFKKFYRIDPKVHVGIALGNGLRWSDVGVIEIPAEQKSCQFTVKLKASEKAFVREIVQLSGEDVFKNYCISCHSLDGSKLIGPTFKGLFGREVEVTRNGVTETVTSDVEYVLESILKPQATIVKGYETVPMADFSPVITPKELDSLVEYLQSNTH